ncbi:MAG: hypothetical protein GX211_02965 [Clostridiaceae bacterium]|nr:hypothetical protein [Clostridiaceae bacterium]
MAKRMKSIVRFILTAFVIFSAALVLYSVTLYRGNYPYYSTYNAGEYGIKAIYLLTKEMGYSPKRFHYPAKFISNETLIVAYRPDILIFNKDEEQLNMKQWLLKGNTLILVPERETVEALWIFDMISEMKKWHEVINVGNITVTWYGVGEGRVCVIDQEDYFLNVNLRDSDAGIAFIGALEQTGIRDVYFNEYYHNIQKPAPGVWELIGTTGQLVVIQLVLSLILVAVKGWKPFGRDNRENYWSKRPENEVLIALSNLYARMRSYPLVLANYYGYFRHKYGRFLTVTGPLQYRAVQTLSACERYIEGGSRNRKLLINLMRDLYKIEEEIRKGMKKIWN